jgi:hypothetical protein
MVSMLYELELLDFNLLFEQFRLQNFNTTVKNTQSGSGSTRLNQTDPDLEAPVLILERRI